MKFSLLIFLMLVFKQYYAPGIWPETIIYTAATPNFIAAVEVFILLFLILNNFNMQY